MVHISSDDKVYGLNRCKRRVEKLKKELRDYTERQNNLSVYDYEQMGRLKEAIYIYEDIIDYWEILIEEQ